MKIDCRKKKITPQAVGDKKVFSAKWLLAPCGGFGAESV